MKKGFTQAEMMIALTELNLTGLIEYQSDDNFHLTEKGESYAAGILLRLPIKDRVALSMHILAIETEVLESESKDSEEETEVPKKVKEAERTIQIEAPVDVTVEYWYERPQDMPESEQEHVRTQLEQGYVEGELNDEGGNRGWWKKTSDEKLHYS